jgi:hypothetical protein
MPTLAKAFRNLRHSGPLLPEASTSGNLRVLGSLLGPAYRGPKHRERQDWALQLALLMRNRFLAHEFWEEYWGHALKRPESDALVLRSPFMHLFRQTMFKRVVPNLKRIRPRYAALGLLAFENLRAAPELSAADWLEEG